MYSKCGRRMEGKKRVVPREVCAECSERSKHYSERIRLGFQRRGVPCIRYTDDIVLLAKSERAARRLLETSTKYLEKTLKLKVNREKKLAVSVFVIRNFKFLCFCMGKNGKGIYTCVHWKVDVYLETVETAKDKYEEAEGIGRSRMADISDSKHTKRLLADG